jgi:hypothetical protein
LDVGHGISHAKFDRGIDVVEADVPPELAGIGDQPGTAHRSDLGIEFCNILNRIRNSGAREAESAKDPARFETGPPPFQEGGRTGKCVQNGDQDTSVVHHAEACWPVGNANVDVQGKR